MEPDQLTADSEQYPRRNKWLLVATISVIAALILIGVPLLSDIAYSPQTSGSVAPTVPPLPAATQARLRTIEREAAGLRQLKPLHPVKVVFLPSPAFSRRVAKLFNSGLSNEAVAVNYQEWALSGLIPPKTNVRKLLTGGVASQIAGWYSFRTKRLYIRDTGEALGIDRWYIAHEYTHALQDQHFNLKKLEADPVRHAIHNSDRALAIRSLVEGDAVTIQYAYLAQFYSHAEKVALNKQLESLTSQPLPRALEEQFQFPYTVGPTYVQDLIATSGYAAVDAKLRHPPTNTFELLFPGRSVRARLPHLTRVLGRFRSWKVLDGDVAGAFGSEQLVEQEVPSKDAGSLAQMWRGDRYVCIRNGKKYAMLMEFHYADPTSASNAAMIFEDAMASRYRGLRNFPGGQWGGETGFFGAIRIHGTRVTLAFAHAARTARELALAPTS